MQKIRLLFKQSLTLFVFIVTFLGYDNVLAETTETAKADTQHEQHKQNSIDWPGVYLGFTPCDDCQGIKTTLALNKNNTYLLMTQLVGKSPRELVEKGSFTWNNESHVIVLTPRKGGSKTHQYLVEENRLIQLDDQGNQFTGDLAERYILRRTEMEERSGQQHTNH